MEIEESPQGDLSSKRKLDSTNKMNTETEQNTEQEKHPGIAPPEKKPYGAHGIRRETMDLRMDFPNARNQTEVYRMWIKL